MRARVAELALEAGACLVNDVSGGLADPDMPRLVAKALVPYVVMHWRGHSHDMNSRAVYDDVVREVRDELRRRVDAVVAEGVDPSMIVLDPGLGFSKLNEHNWRLLAALPDIACLGAGKGAGEGAGTGAALGAWVRAAAGPDADGPPRRFPVLVGASRKRFLGRLLATADGTPRSFTGSDDATVATTALAAAAGAWCVRVHKVPANADAVRVAAAWRAAGGNPGEDPGEDQR